MFPLIAALRPRLAARLTRRGNRIGAPLLLAGVGIVGGDEPTDAGFAARRADHHLAARDQRRERDVVGGLAIGNRGCPYRAARFHIQRHKLRFGGGVIYFVAIQRDATVHVVQNNCALRPRLAITPQDIAGLRIEVQSPDRSGVDMNIAPLLTKGAASCTRDSPVIVDQTRRSFDTFVGVDLIERAIAPAVIRAANHQPIAVRRVFQTLRGDRRIILQKERNGRRSGPFSFLFLLLGAAGDFGSSISPALIVIVLNVEARTCNSSEFGDGQDFEHSKVIVFGCSDECDFGLDSRQRGEMLEPVFGCAREVLF